MTTPLVPTLDAAHERGRDLVWCAALPLAWEALRAVLGGAVRLRNAPQPAGAAALVATLEAQRPASGAVDPAAFLASAGVDDAQWAERIERELHARFGADVDAPLLPAPAERGLLTAYAYLSKAWSLPTPLCRTYGWFRFAGVACDSFGLWDSDPPSPRFEARAAEIVVHHHRPIRDDEYAHEPTNDDPTEEWVVELLPEDRSDRVLVARCIPGATLAATVAWVWGHAQRAPTDLERPALDRRERLEVPCLDFDLSSNLPEIRGALLEHAVEGADVLGEVRQRVRFRLDEGGARVTADARIGGLSLPPRILVCDGPFLVLVQRRGAQLPTLAAWVATPALVVRAP